MAKSHVLFVAGGLWQMFYMEYLKSKNHKVAIINPIKTKTTSLADYHIEKDVKDIDGILTEVKKINFKPDFVCSDQCEIAMPTICKLSEIFNLNAPSSESITLFTQKPAMYKHAIKHGINVPEFLELDHYSDSIPMKYPFIIKPADSTSSRGFFKCEENFTKDQFDECSKFGKVMVQKFVSGIEITLEGICQNYNHTTLATSSKQHFRPGIASSLRYPANIPSELLSNIIKANDVFVNKSGFKFGITHAEYIVDLESQNFWLIEIAGRGGGCGISSHIIKAVSGTDILDCHTRMMLGEAISIKQENNPCLLQFFEFIPEEKRPNLELITNEIKEMKNVLLFQFNFLEYQYLKPAKTDGDRHAIVICTENIDQTISDIKDIFAKQGLQC